MSAQPPPMQPQAPAQQQPPPMTPQMRHEAEMDQVLEQLLGGELPGAGYLFQDDPEKRQAQLVKTTPEFVRSALLRAIEVAAFAQTLPFSMEKKSELSDQVLKNAQAYLLLDPSVDENGIPVEGPGSKAHATASAQAQFRPPPAPGQPGHQQFEEPINKTTGHPEPPRVKPNPAEEEIANEHQGESEDLRGARGDKPRPKPRIGS